jgi:hypothetical protein
MLKGTMSTEEESNPDAHNVGEQTVRQHQSIANQQIVTWTLARELQTSVAF